MNSKGSLKTGANIILRSGAEKKPHQSNNEPSTASNANSTKELSTSSNNNSNISSLGDVSKPQPVPAMPAWGQGKKWSQLFTIPPKDSAVSSSSTVNSKDINKQNESTSCATEEQTHVAQNPEKVNQQLKHLGGI